MKDLDKFEMILQAYNYEVDQSRPGGLQEFYDSTRGTRPHVVAVESANENMIELSI